MIKWWRRKAISLLDKIKKSIQPRPTGSRGETEYVSPKSNREKLITIVKTEFGIGARVAFGASVKDSNIGAYSAIGRYSKIKNTNIGKFCAISWDVTINANNHPYNHLSMSAFPYVRRMGFVETDAIPMLDVHIGNDVWIGAGVIILPGIRIGDGAVIGAGAVVTKDVEPYTIVAGVPARPKKLRFPPEIISVLQQLRWWDMDEAWLREHITLFQREITIADLEMLEELSQNLNSNRS